MSTNVRTPFLGTPLVPLKLGAIRAVRGDAAMCGACGRLARATRGRVRQVSRRAALLRDVRLTYTQFAIQDSRLFGPNPWKILAPPSNYLSTNKFWATQPLEQILDSEFLLCELDVILSQGEPHV